MNSLLNDLRYALRQLRRSPGFTATAVLTLALGIGASAAVSSVIRSVVLEPLPYTDPDRLVGVSFTYPFELPNADQAGITADFIREHSASFSSVAIMDDSGPAVNLSVTGGRAVQVNALGVSEGYFRTLGATPALGRTFTPDEDRPDGGRSVILSDGLWTRVFGRDPAILGRAIRINQETFTVVGVMPASFAVSIESAPGVLGTPDLWRPLQLGPKSPGYEGDNWEMIARLRPGATLMQARQELTILQSAFYQQFPAFRKAYTIRNITYQFRAWALQDVMVTGVRRSLFTVMGAVTAVLLLACLNLAGLMMARTLRRSRELAMRQALGASRMRLIRVIACEGLLLACAGGLLAVLVARGSASVLLHATPLAIPNLRGEPSLWLLSAIVFAFALGATAIFSLIPAWMVLRAGSTQNRLSGFSFGETVAHARLSRALLMGQVALAMLLVSAASVLFGTFVKLRTLPSGIVPKQVTVFQVTLKGDRYASTRQTTQFVTTVLDRLRGTPGVDRVAAINGLPLDRGLNIGGNPAGRGDQHRNVEFRTVTPGYFETMGLPLLAGRDFADSDRVGSDPVVIIGASTAKKWWPGRSPVGESVQIQGEGNWRIIGVVPDVRMHSLVESGGIEIYAPMAQQADSFTRMINGWFPTSFSVRTAARINLAQAAQNAVERADPEIPMARMATMQSVIDSTIEEPRFLSILAGGFSIFALVLTVIGLFGLLNYQVTQRTREIGVRMALGADRVTILRVFLGRGMAVSSLGVVVGLIAAWLLRPVLTNLMADAGVGSSATAQSIVMNSAMAAVLAALTILMTALAASWLPARRAASIEPMEALRSE